MVGIMEQDVALGHLIQDAPAVDQMPVWQRLQLAEHQIWMVQVGEIHQVSAVVIPPTRDDVGLLNHTEFAHQKLQEVLRHLTVKEETHIIAVLSPCDAFFHLLQKRLGEVVVHVDLSIARHLDGISPNRVRLYGGKDLCISTYVNVDVSACNTLSTRCGKSCALL